MVLSEYRNKRENELLLCCLALGALYDYLFYDGTFIGIAYPIFIVAVFALFFWRFNPRRPFPLHGFPCFLLVAILLLSFTFALFSN